MTENKCEKCGAVFDSKEKLMEHAGLHIGKPKHMVEPKNIVISSIVGGIAGGILMLLVLMAGAVEMGLNSTAFAQIMGMGLGASMSSAVMVGLAGHFTVSIVAGAIFGIIVSFVKPLTLKSGPRSVIFGVIFAIVVYLVFFLPMAMTVFASVMMKLMGSKASMMMPDVLMVGFIGHLLYGIALGMVAYYLSRKL